MCTSDIFVRVYNLTSGVFLSSFRIPGLIVVLFQLISGASIASQALLNQNIVFVANSDGLWSVNLAYQKAIYTPKLFYNFPGLYYGESHFQPFLLWIYFKIATFCREVEAKEPFTSSMLQHLMTTTPISKHKLM